jgi:hypothetical protein
MLNYQRVRFAIRRENRRAPFIIHHDDTDTDTFGMSLKHFHTTRDVREYTVGTDTYYLQDFISGLGLNCHLTTQSHKTQNKFLRIKIPQSCHQPLKFWNFAFTSYRRQVLWSMSKPRVSATSISSVYDSPSKLPLKFPLDFFQNTKCQLIRVIIKH